MSSLKSDKRKRLKKSGEKAKMPIANKRKK